MLANKFVIRYCVIACYFIIFLVIEHNMHLNVDMYCNFYNIAASCSKDEFQCKNGSCIKSSLVCNNVLDCSDGTGEIICSKYMVG
jgi:hypothetical protein